MSDLIVTSTRQWQAMQLIFLDDTHARSTTSGTEMLNGFEVRNVYPLNNGIEAAGPTRAASRTRSAMGCCF